MYEQTERVVEQYKLWYPTFYSQTISYVTTGYHLLLAVLDDGSKVEFCSLDNSLRDVTKSYDPEFNSNMSDDDYKKEFGNRLKTLLRDRSLKHENLADIIGVSRQSISMYINGKAMPNIRIVRCIARALDCDVRDLIDFDYVLRK